MSTCGTLVLKTHLKKNCFSTHNTWTADVWGFLSPSRISTDPTGQTLSPTRRLPPQMPIPQVVGSPDHPHFCLTWLLIRDSMTCNLLEWLRTQGTIYVYLWFIRKDVTKDTDAQPEEEAHGVRSRTVPSAGASVPMELRYATLLARGCVHQPRSSQNPAVEGFYGDSIM